jgi:ArsR family transcriptional regulator
MENTPDIFTIEAEILTALAHPSRLEILELLRDGERCVCHIQAVLDQRQAYVSQHLNILRQAQIFVMMDSLKTILRIQSRRQVWLPAGTISIVPRKPCSCPQCAPSPA